MGVISHACTMWCCAQSDGWRHEQAWSLPSKTHWEGQVAPLFLPNFPPSFLFHLLSFYHALSHAWGANTQFPHNQYIIKCLPMLTTVWSALDILEKVYKEMSKHTDSRDRNALRLINKTGRHGRESPELHGADGLGLCPWKTSCGPSFKMLSWKQGRTAGAEATCCQKKDLCLWREVLSREGSEGCGRLCKFAVQSSVSTIQHTYLASESANWNPSLHICQMDRGQYTDFPPCWPHDAREITPPSTSLLCHLQTKLSTVSFLSPLHGKKAHGLLEGKG